MVGAGDVLAPVLLALAAAARAEPGKAADLAVTNARVWTGDAARPTLVIDAGGRRVLPGFDDSHVHFFDGSAKLAQVKLKDARSPEELARRIAAHARTLARGEWVLGSTWDDQAFAHPRLPTRQDVDPITPETPVQDTGPAPGDVAACAELLERGELTLRVSAAPLETRWEEQARLGLRRAFGSPWLRLGAVKGFADGSLGSTTAFFFDTYDDAPGTSGLLSDEMQPIEAMRERLVGADAAGLQLCIHAIGDRAISTVLDLYEDVLARNGARGRRWRIEHAQHVAPKDFARFAALGVVASVQPYHAIDDGRWAERRIGPGRAKTTYAFRSFLDTGVRPALGTDWYVAPLDPMQTLCAAVTRRTLDGKHPEGCVPEQKISLAEAIRAYTAGAAYAEFQEKEKGTLSPGKLADLVILGEDVFAVPPERLRDVRVETTIVGGRVVYERER